MCTEDLIVASLPQAETSPHAKCANLFALLLVHHSKAVPFPDTGMCRALNTLSLHFSKQSEEKFCSLPIVFPECGDNSF